MRLTLAENKMFIDQCRALCAQYDATGSCHLAGDFIDGYVEMIYTCQGVRFESLEELERLLKLKAFW